MKAIFGFIWGVFAHHIGTKILSLLLAILLFVFVQQSGQGETTIGEIRLRFKLSEELKESYVLLDTEVRLSEVRIQGKRSVVDEVAREYALDNTREVTVTRAFLGTHARGKRIEITSRLIRDIESRQIDVVAGLDGQRIRFDDKETRTFDVVLSPGQDDKLELGEGSPYLPAEEDGERVNVRFSIERVTIEGPESAFEEPSDKLFVRIPDLDRALREVRAEEEEPIIELPVTSSEAGYIDWKLSGIDPGRLGYLIVNDGTRDMTDTIFEESLQMLFRVRAQVVSRTLDSVPIVVRRKVLGDENIAERNVLSNVINQTDIERQYVSLLPLRMPAALAERLDQFGDNLVLVLDLVRARRTETDLEVPIYLDFRDRSKGKPEDLRRISIDIEGDLIAAFPLKE